MGARVTDRFSVGPIGIPADQPAPRTGTLLVAGFAICASYVLLALCAPELRVALGDEDQLIENLGALAFAAASAAMVYAYATSTDRARFFGFATRRNVWFLLLAVFFFICAGEEISWGQRLFGWATPEWLERANAQRETNLHNLWVFQAYNPDKSSKSSLELLLNANRLLSAFWLTYALLLPLLLPYTARGRSMIGWAGVPVPPLSFGLLFLLSYVTFRAVIGLGSYSMKDVSAFDELKETIYGFCFALIAFHFAASGRSRPAAGR